MTKELSRLSALASRHRALGSALEDWNGMGTAWSYNTDPDIEHNAIRESAGLFDMSGLKKVRVKGEDGLAVINHMFTRDLSKIYPGKSAYGSVLTTSGTVCDDAIIYNNGTEWLVVHGSGETMERLQESAQGKDVNIVLDDDLHNLSLQGPKALFFLDKFSPLDLSQLKYFHQQQTTLFGEECLISRTGYSGERGYEIFVNANSACTIWDNILSEGESQGIIACSFTSLDKVRIEAGLLFFGYDMMAEHSPWEVGLGWTIDKKKPDFRGRDAVLKSQGKERFKYAGIVVNHNDCLMGGENIMLDNKQIIGTVNSPCWSARMNKSLALVHVDKDFCTIGQKLLIETEDAELTAEIVETPFYNPTKSKTHEEG